MEIRLAQAATHVRFLKYCINSWLSCSSISRAHTTFEASISASVVHPLKDPKLWMASYRTMIKCCPGVFSGDAEYWPGAYCRAAMDPQFGRAPRSPLTRKTIIAKRISGIVLRSEIPNRLSPPSPESHVSHALKQNHVKKARGRCEIVWERNQISTASPSRNTASASKGNRIRESRHDQGSANKGIVEPAPGKSSRTRSDLGRACLMKPNQSPLPGST